MRRTMPSRCVYCGAPCRGSVCYAHRDLPLRDPLTRRVTTTATVTKVVEAVNGEGAITRPPHTVPPEQREETAKA
jgi:hypothetical protein